MGKTNNPPKVETKKESKKPLKTSKLKPKFKAK